MRTKTRKSTREMSEEELRDEMVKCGFGEPLPNTCPNCKKDLMGGVVAQMEHYDECDKGAVVTKEDFKNLLDELSKSKKSKGFNAMISCKSRGLISVNFESNWMCNDTECTTCSNFREALDGIMKEQISTERKKIYKEDYKKDEFEFDDNSDYEREQNRLRQRHYRNKKNNY